MWFFIQLNFFVIKTDPCVLTCDVFNSKLSKEIFKGNDEGSFCKLKDVDSIENLLFKDIAQVRSDNPDVDIFVVDRDILGKSIGVMEKEYEYTSILELTEILPTTGNLIPSMVN